MWAAFGVLLGIGALAFTFSLGFLIGCMYAAEG